MSDKKPKIKYVAKTERQPNVDEDLERLDISRLRLLIQKYPQKAKEFLRQNELKTA